MSTVRISNARSARVLACALALCCAGVFGCEDRRYAPRGLDGDRVEDDPSGGGSGGTPGSSLPDPDVDDAVVDIDPDAEDANGIALTTPLYDAAPRHVALGDDGRVTLALEGDGRSRVLPGGDGRVETVDGTWAALARLTPEGRLEDIADFTTSGASLRIEAFHQRDDGASLAAVAWDGSMRIPGGEILRASAERPEGALVGFDADLNPTFIVELSVGFNTICQDLDPLDDGGWVVTCYAGEGLGRIMRLDATGAVVWQADVTPPIMGAETYAYAFQATRVLDGLIFVSVWHNRGASFNGGPFLGVDPGAPEGGYTLVALDADSGEPRWDALINDTSSLAMVFAGAVLTVNNSPEPRLVGRSARDGAPLWAVDYALAPGSTATMFGPIRRGDPNRALYGVINARLADPPRFVSLMVELDAQANLRPSRAARIDACAGPFDVAPNGERFVIVCDRLHAEGTLAEPFNDDPSLNFTVNVIDWPR